MQKFTLAILIGSLAVPSLSFAAKPSCGDLKGDWINELGSTLTITSVDKDGKILGTYMSPSGTSGGAAPLIGWTNSLPPVAGQNNATIVSFSVNWGSYGSVTSWSGTCFNVGGKSTIKTVWNLVRSNSSYEWDHILTNSDIFLPK